MQDLSLDDLASCAPDVAKGLANLLAYQRRDEEEVYGLTFEMTVTDVDGSKENIELKVSLPLV